MRSAATNGCRQHRPYRQRRPHRQRLDPPRQVVALLTLSAAIATGCADRPAADGSDAAVEPDPPPAAVAAPPPETGEEIFVERAEALGLDFVHFNGMSGELYFVEIVGSGAALFDADGDGDLDAYLVQGNLLGAAADPAHRDRLFRNRLVETGELAFEDVTEQSGMVSDGYGMGVAAGDVDNDGDVDLYVTAFGANRLYRNDSADNDPAGGGAIRFTDITGASGTGDERWSTSAAFTDYDLDGRLDLYVANYVSFTLATHKECYAETSARDYCGPLSYQPYPDRLLRGIGDGKFEDVSGSARIVTAFGGALGVVASDFNSDGRPDFYVANDGLANQLWINQGSGDDGGPVTFSDQALLAGCAYNRDGQAEGSMGIGAADFDDDGDDDLFMTHITGETNTLFRNHDGLFDDDTRKTGLGMPSRAATGFGTAFFDHDNDGRLDLLVANGAVKTIEKLALAGDPFPLHQTNQLFSNLAGDGGAVRFSEVTARAGEAFALSEVSRGAAFGDVDNDGDADVLVVNNNGRARLLLNRVGQDRSWLGLRLVHENGRDAYGARVACVLAGERTLWRRPRADGSYCSSNDPRVLFGLGEAAAVEAVRVHWPDGRSEEWDWRQTPINRYHTLVQGRGGTPQ